MFAALLMAATLVSAGKGGIDLNVESESRAVEPSQSIFLRVVLRSPRGVTAQQPDLRERVKGFSLAEDFAEEPKTEPDGTLVQITNWRLVPEACADDYRVKPFVVSATTEQGADVSFVAGPVRFDPPAARESVTGGFEVDPKKDLPPFSWKLAGWCVLVLLGVVAIGAGVFFGVRTLARRVKEHRMSPIERAWVELDRLLKKGLPGRGRYKDFYVELTMVVRRYVQRKYGIRAPHLTTEEFFAELVRSREQTQEQIEGLRRFLEAADMVKFAGVEATPDMADGATESARGYLKGDADVRRDPSLEHDSSITTQKEITKP